MRQFRRRAATALALVGALTPAAAPQEKTSSDRTPSRLAPSLEHMENGQRRRVEASRAELDALLAAAAPAAAIAEAAGALGRLYLAYELFDAATAAFRAALDATPDDARWLYYLGVALETRGELDAALQALERARALEPRDPATLVRLGSLLLELDRPDRAREVFTAALSADPPAAAAAQHGLGKVAALAGDLAAAVEHFEQALALDPDATVVHYPLAQAYRKLGDLERARDHLGRRGDVEPRFPDPLGDEVAWVVLGTAFGALLELAAAEGGFSERDFMGFVQSHFGEVEGVEHELAEALRIRDEEARSLVPSSPAAGRDRLVRARIHYALGGLLVDRRRDDEAARHLRAALELEPGLEDARIRLGNVLARGGDLELAAAEYTAVLERNPDSAPALLRRGAALTTLGRAEDAIADLERLHALEPGNAEGLVRLATLLADRGDGERARLLYRDAVRLDLEPQERFAAHTGLGNVEWRRGSLEAAADAYRVAIEADPGATEVRFKLATVLGGIDRFEEAAAAYREILDANPDHEPARLGEATVLALGGREAEARARLEEGLGALPRSLALTHALARLLATATDPAVRDGARAVELATRAVQAQSDLVHAETLAMALAEAGRLADAVALQERLVAEAETRDDDTALPRLLRHLALYREGHPCCPRADL